MGTYIREQTFTQLTAPGQTVGVLCGEVYNHSFQVKAASVDTNVIVGLQGSMDGTNWFEISLSSTAVANLTLASNRVTIADDGTFVLTASVKCEQIRFNFISETGGTAATLDVHYWGGN